LVQPGHGQILRRRLRRDGPGNGQQGKREETPFKRPPFRTDAIHRKIPFPQNLDAVHNT
jgi:hypothetical protein